MLILTRRVGEAIVIGEEVTVTMLGVKGNQVRVGVNAPSSVSVHREEIAERIKAEAQVLECRCGWDRSPGSLIPTDSKRRCMQCGMPVTSAAPAPLTPPPVAVPPDPLFTERQVREFCGFITAYLSQLHGTSPQNVWQGWEAYLKVDENLRRPQIRNHPDPMGVRSRGGA